MLSLRGAALSDRLKNNSLRWLAVLAWIAVPTWAYADTLNAWQALKTPGAIVMFRHALAPGGGDPAGFVLGDCTTQRNLSPQGREQAARIGEVLRQTKVAVSAIWHSEWCRTRDTARLAFPDRAGQELRAKPAFNSFFGSPDSEPAQTAAAKSLLLGWRGSGVLVVVTHQVNITALTGIVPQSGEGVVLLQENGQLLLKGKLLP